jgi:hypothetical protein
MSRSRAIGNVRDGLCRATVFALAPCAEGAVRMQTIKRFDVFSVMKIAAALFAFFGLCEGLIMGLVVAARILARAGRPDTHLFLAPLIAIASILLIPLLFAAFGAINGAVSAGLYNLAVRFVGGIKVEIE